MTKEALRPLWWCWVVGMDEEEEEISTRGEVPFMVGLPGTHSYSAHSQSDESSFLKVTNAEASIVIYALNAVFTVFLLSAGKCRHAQ